MNPRWFALLCLTAIGFALVAGCVSEERQQQRQVQAERVANRPVLQNVAFTANDSWATLTYTPDGSESEVSIVPVDTVYTTDVPGGISKTWQHPTGPVSYSQPRFQAAPVFQVLISRGPDATLWYVETEWGN